MNKHPVRMEQDVLSFLQLFAAQLPACGIDVRPMFPTVSATDFLFAQRFDKRFDRFFRAPFILDMFIHRIVRNQVDVRQMAFIF